MYEFLVNDNPFGTATKTFDLSGATGQETKPIDVRKFTIASLQLRYVGATSSDSFVSKGTFTVQGSNDGVKWNDVDTSAVTATVDAAAGSALKINIKLSFVFIRIIWTKNNNTAGTAWLTLCAKPGA